MPLKRDDKFNIKIKQQLATRERQGGRRHQRTWGMKAEAEDAASGGKCNNNHPSTTRPWAGSIVQ
jgi:hypothetical protein